MMGFIDKLKKLLGFKKEDVEFRNSVNDEVIDEPTFTESIENDNGNFNDNDEIQSEDSEETPVNEEVIDKPTPNKIKNFKYLDNLIHSGAKEIVLDSDIVLDDDGEESEYKDGITLDVDDLAIDGNGHAIDAKSKARIFYCTERNITIKNIILKNGFSEDNGGAINNKGSITITESTLNNNIARDGGAIYNYTGELTITDSTLNNNKAQGDGGAIYNYTSELTITDSTLNNNTAQGLYLGGGGAIYNWKGKLTIHDSTLNNNTAQGLYMVGGGAIYNYSGELTITESTFTENTAQELGGAIRNKEGWLTITESTLTENTAKYGGAINSYKSRKYESKNCTFKDNKPDDVC